MDETLAQHLDATAELSVSNSARNRIEQRILEETEIVNFWQLATFCDVLAHRVALEVQEGGDYDSSEALLANAQTISETMRRLHEVIQTMTQSRIWVLKMSTNM